MARIACTLMQKDEEILLEAWLLYHGYLFGYENLYVWDNGSTLSHPKDVLLKFSKLGVNVFWDRNTPSDFDKKGKIIGELVHSFRKNKKYDIVLPLDCDEFFSISGQNGLSTSRPEIHEYLDSILDRDGAPDMMWAFTNWPGHLDVYMVDIFRKSIIPVDRFVDIDHGFHRVALSEDTGRFQTKVIYFHLHHKPLDMIKRHAIEKLRPYVDVDDDQAVRGYKGINDHLVRYWGMDESSYCDKIRNRSSLAVTSALENHFQAFGITEKIRPIWEQSKNKYAVFFQENGLVPLDGVYDRDRYLFLNQDLIRVDNDPLVHYVRHGFSEGRKMK